MYIHLLCRLSTSAILNWSERVFYSSAFRPTVQYNNHRIESDCFIHQNQLVPLHKTAVYSENINVYNFIPSNEMARKLRTQISAILHHVTILNSGMLCNLFGKEFKKKKKITTADIRIKMRTQQESSPSSKFLFTHRVGLS